MNWEAELIEAEAEEEAEAEVEWQRGPHEAVDIWGGGRTLGQFNP